MCRWTLSGLLRNDNDHTARAMVPYASGGVSANRALPIASGYLPPCTSAASQAWRISFSSSFESLMWRAPRFSSIRGILVVPGIGKKSSPARDQNERLNMGLGEGRERVFRVSASLAYAAFHGNPPSKGYSRGI